MRATFAFVCSLLLAVPMPLAAQPLQAPGLTIVVIAGEDAVNIIQQKTAVAPIIEVRDRNNLPVSGVAVTFSVGGQGASFAGASTLTVTTNAAGQAVAAGLTPTATGAIQINVTAVLQGQTVTATITQTNFATVAQATQVAGAGSGSGSGGASGSGSGGASGGAAGGAGGGLSGATLGIIGGAVAAAGALVATQAGGGSDAPAATTSAGTPTATTPPVTTTPTAPVAPPNQPPPAATCVFSVTPTTVTIPIEGGTAVITVTLTNPGCANPTWIVTQIPSIVRVDRTSGTGSGTVTLTVEPFTPTSTSPARTTAVGIADTVVHILQPRGLSATPACISELRHGAGAGEVRRIELGSNAGNFLFNYSTGSLGTSRMMVMYEGRALFDTGCTGTAASGMQSLAYAGRDTAVTVQVMPNCAGGSGTSWEYRLSCPR